MFKIGRYPDHIHVGVQDSVFTAAVQERGVDVVLTLYESRLGEHAFYRVDKKIGVRDCVDR
jgi:hypothetical protein